MSDSTVGFHKLTPMIPAGSDIRAALDFYERTLGFNVVYKSEDLGTIILMRGQVDILLTNFDDPHTASQTSLRIQVSEVDALHREYQSHAIPPFEQPGGAGLSGLKDTPWGTREFAIRDLAGVCITFYENRSA